MGPSTKPDWGSTHDARGIASRLSSARRAVVVTHGKPDGDAVGSTLAIARALALRGAWAEVWYIGPVAPWVLELVGKVPRRVFESGQAATGPGASDAYDTLVCVDTGTWSQLAEFKGWMPALADRAVLIDHHLHGDPDVASTRLVDTTCASCTQVLSPVVCDMLGLASPADLPHEIAEPLYLGLATDTGWFRYSNVTPETMRLAGDLLRAGVDHTRLYRIIEQQDQPARWKLLGRALSSLELFHGGRVAVQALRLSDFAQTGADRNDTTGFADMVLAVASVQASAVISESDQSTPDAPLCKISLRTKPGPDAIDANRVLGGLGGGGHARAAGAKVRASIDETRRRLLELLA
ncbi:MAG: DHH family phosphoesterase [Phycisphaeraceae bacterium]|nr:DHH family phosphoesterase [Phycisphaeraceae bacterium]